MGKWERSWNSTDRSVLHNDAVSHDQDRRSDVLIPGWFSSCVCAGPETVCGRAAALKLIHLGRGREIHRRVNGGALVVRLRPVRRAARIAPLAA